MQRGGLFSGPPPPVLQFCHTKGKTLEGLQMLRPVFVTKFLGFVIKVWTQHLQVIKFFAQTADTPSGTGVPSALTFL